MDFESYKRRFRESLGRLAAPRDCKAERPRFRPLPPHPYSWMLTWELRFKDGKYIRVKEHYSKIRGRSGARRLYFSFHYGPDPAPAEPMASDPVDIRIDKKSGQPPHMHYNEPGDHIGQDRVSGLALEGVELFDFLKGIFKHRSTKHPIHEVFGFTIR